MDHPMDHPETMLDREVTLTVPVKFLTAILRATEEGAIFQAMKIVEGDCNERDIEIRTAIIRCYEEVHNTVLEVHDKVLKPEEIARIQKFARALGENEGVKN